jgi:hypothetical protein
MTCLGRFPYPLVLYVQRRAAIGGRGWGFYSPQTEFPQLFLLASSDIVKGPLTTVNLRRLLSLVGFPELCLPLCEQSLYKTLFSSSILQVRQFISVRFKITHLPPEL